MIFQRSNCSTHYGLVAMDEATSTPVSFLHVLQALAKPLSSSSSSYFSSPSASPPSSSSSSPPSSITDITPSTSSSPSTPHATALLLEALQACTFSAAFWECPPISHWILTTTQTPFECMLLAAPALEGMAARGGADDRPFREHFDKHHRWKEEKKKDDEEEVGGSICVFDNLGKDATLVVPAYLGRGDKGSYSHFLSYLRAPFVPTSQKLALLQRVARVTLDKCMHKRKGGGGGDGVDEEELVWVSTSGMGVAWLHVRVEDRPKYYCWQEYVSRGRTGRRGEGGVEEGCGRKSGKKY